MPRLSSEWSLQDGQLFETKGSQLSRRERQTVSRQYGTRMDRRKLKGPVQTGCQMVCGQDGPRMESNIVGRFTRMGT